MSRIIREARLHLLWYQLITTILSRKMERTILLITTIPNVSSLNYYCDQFFPLLIMYIPRAANPPARAYFKWNVSPRQRHEVTAPATGISEL